MESYIIVGIYLFLCLCSYIGILKYYSGKEKKNLDFEKQFFGLMFPFLPIILIIFLIVYLVSKLTDKICGNG